MGSVLLLRHKSMCCCPPGVNFINVKRTNISYEHRFSSYVLALSENSYKKRAHKTLMKLTPVVTHILIVLLEHRELKIIKLKTNESSWSYTPFGLTKFQSILNFPLFLWIQISLTISLCVKISLVQFNFLPLFC
jgi:hypothetical protein